MNSHQRRKERRAVERGFGPRHAFNAQEGDEAVPSPLPEPPPELYRELGWQGRALEALRRQAVPDEVIEEIRRNPTGAKALSTYAALGIMLMPGMGGKRGGGVPKSGKVPQPGLKVPEVAPRYEGPPEAKDPFQEHLEEHYPHGTSGMFEDPPPHSTKLDEQFPSLNKPPYDALKEKYPEIKEGPYKGQKPFDPQESEDINAINQGLPSEKTPSWHELSPEGQEQFFKEGGFKDKLEAAMNWDYYAGHMPEEIKPLEPKDPSFPPEEVQKMQDLQDFLKPKEEPPKGQYWTDKLMDWQKEHPPSEEPPLNKPHLRGISRRNPKKPSSEEPPQFEPRNPDDPFDRMPGSQGFPEFKKGTRGVRHSPKTHTGRPKKIGVERGYGPRHAANAKEGEDLTAINTDTVPAMLTPREAVLNRNAAELAGRDQIEALNEQGNELAKRGVDLAAEGESDVHGDPRKLAGGGAQSAILRQLYEKYGIMLPDDVLIPDFMKRSENVPPVLAAKGLENVDHPLKIYHKKIGRLDESPAERKLEKKKYLEVQKGTQNVKPNQSKPKGMQTGDDYVGYPAHLRPPALGGGAVLGQPPGQIGGMQGPQPNLDWQHKRNMAQQGPGLDWQHKRNAAIGAGFDQPALPPGGAALGGPYGEPPGYGAKLGEPFPPQNPPVFPGAKLGGPGGGGFYPPGQRMALGEPDVTGIGEVPVGQEAYSKEPFKFSSPDLSAFLKSIQEQAKKQGFNPQQIAGIVKAFQGMGGGGYANQSLSAGEDFGNPNYIGLGTPSYQGGISEVGYPPMIAPNAVWHTDGGGWRGPYDPDFMFPGYAGGTDDVPGLRRGSRDFGGGGADFFGIEPGQLNQFLNFGRPSSWATGGGQYSRSGLTNRSTYNPLSFTGLAGMPWSPTMIPTTYNPQGYPRAVPVGPDQNLQGVGRTHNLRKTE